MYLDRLKANWKKWFIYSLRIALGSSLAVLTAHACGLLFYTQAGVICIFSMLTTAKDTLKLSVARLISFGITAAAAFVLFHYVPSEWVAFGIFIFITVMASELFGWGAALSANVVAGTHFLSVDNFTTGVIINEFYIVIIGMLFAFLFNLFRATDTTKKKLDGGIASIQNEMQSILTGTADYLAGTLGDRDIWKEIDVLLSGLNRWIHLSAEYEGNSFEDNPEYYIRYFEMRERQCEILEELHAELRKIKSLPKQAAVVEDYIRYMSKYVTAMNVPTEQLARLDDIFAHMKNEPLPVTRDEFENRAVLYHILMSLEDFLLVKQRYIQTDMAVK